ncbi:MAG: hypothetical protein J6N19_03650 [Clostridium sp.]|nr:hypothetical protein [Clostridium sp.]
MSVASNVTIVTFKPGKRHAIVDPPLWQYDVGQILKFGDLDLPSVYEVQFSNEPFKGKAKPQIGGPDGVEIPNEYFLSGASIHAWLYLHVGANDGAVEYHVEIPINRKSERVEEEFTPVQRDFAEQTLAALTQVSAEVTTARDETIEAAESILGAEERVEAHAEQVAANAQAAAASEVNAKASEDAAKQSELNAKESEDNAKASEDAAALSETNAAQSEANAKASEDAAALSEVNAKASEDAAKVSEQNAATAEGVATAAQNASEEARDLAYDAVDLAAQYAENARQVATEVGFINFEIDENGDLIMYKTTNVTGINFSLQEGDLMFHAYYNQ